MTDGDNGNGGLAGVSDEKLLHLERTVSNAASALDYASGLLPDDPDDALANKVSSAAFDANEASASLGIEAKRRNNQQLDEFEGDGDD